MEISFHILNNYLIQGMGSHIVKRDDLRMYITTSEVYPR
jgi:hypothetical protein